MQTNNQWRIALAALVMVGGTGTLWAQQDPFRVPAPTLRPQTPPSIRMVSSGEPDVFKGLKGVQVLVEELPDDAMKIGLTRERLQSATELSLRRNGVPVLTLEEAAKTPGAPWIYVNVNLTTTSFSTMVLIREDVRLVRAPNTVVLGATIWTKSSAGTHTGDADFIVKSVERKVDDFCLDYLKANPK